MKKKFKGLLSLWLVVFMLMTMLPVYATDMPTAIVYTDSTHLFRMNN